MKVSVLLAVYNAAQYLRGAIQSVLDQTYPGFDMLVLDDGSTDPRVHEIIEEIEDPRLSHVRFAPTEEERHATVRYATNLNYGVEHTTGEYITFLCGDDYYMPNRLDRMVACLDRGAHVVYGPQLLLDNDDHQRGLRQAVAPLTDAFHRVDLNSVMLRRAVLEQVGGFVTDPAVWKDADAHTWRKITAAGYVFEPISGGPTDVKRYRANSVSDNVLAGKPPWHHDPAAASTAWREWVPAA